MILYLTETYHGSHLLNLEMEKYIIQKNILAMMLSKNIRLLKYISLNLWLLQCMVLP